MKIRMIAAAVAVLFVSASAHADVKVELKDTHLCCPACVTAANKILKGVEGVTGKCDQKAKSIEITAKDIETAQKAIDALAAGGFHGNTEGKVSVKDDSGVKKGKVKSLTITDVHNCCGACTSAIKKAVKSVEGVKEENLAAKKTEFEVTGDFEAEAVIKALNKAGFHAKVK